MRSLGHEDQTEEGSGSQNYVRPQLGDNRWTFVKAKAGVKIILPQALRYLAICFLGVEGVY